MIDRQIILCAGPPRSGSTWQYNIVRILLTKAGFQCYGAWIGDYDRSRSETVHVVKAHRPNEVAGLDVGVTVSTYRDLRDVIPSVRRMGWGAIDATGFLTDYVALIARWKERADLVTKYEDMMADPVSEAAKIGEIIGLELWPDTVLEAVEDVRALRQPERDPSGPAIQYDRETLLHSGHVAGHREPLDAETRLLIERDFGDWLLEHGYSVEKGTPLNSAQTIP